MRNLKKLVAFIVTLAMIATFAIPAFAAAPADVVGTDYEGAVTRLGALGVINGYPNGDFGPNDPITRAQFAAVVVRALGFESLAATAAGVTKFSDVAANYWGAGYINIAVSLGIINGYGDGKFGPEDKVTFDQAVTMIVRALGYDEHAKAKGGFPTGYLLQANVLGFTSGVVGVAGVPTTRGVVAQLIDKAKEIKIQKQVGFGDTKTYADDGDFLSKLGMTKIEGKIVTQTPASTGLAANTFKVGGVATAYTAIEGAFDIEALLGKKVNLWTNGTKIVLAEATAGTAVAVKSVTEVVYTEDVVTSVKVKLSDDTAKTYTIADEDAGAVETFAADTIGDVVKNLEGVNADQVQINFVVDGDKLLFADAIIFDNDVVATAITSNAVAKWTRFNATYYVKQNDKAIKRIIVVKDGETVDYTAIAKGDILFIAENFGADAANCNDDILYIKATSKTVAGTLEAAKPSLAAATSIKVEGTWYSVSSFLGTLNATANIAGEITLTLDPAGKAYSIAGPTVASANKYGVILGNESSTTLGETVYKVKILTAAGDKVTYTVDNDVAAVKVANAALANKLAKYTLATDGTVDSLVIAETIALVDQEQEFDTSRLQFGTTDVSSGVVMFTTSKVVKLADIDDDTDATATAIFKDGTPIVAMLLSAYEPAVSSATYGYVNDFVVTGAGKYLVDLVTKDGIKTYATETFTPEKGDFVKYALDANNKMVSVVAGEASAITGTTLASADADKVNNGSNKWYADNAFVVYDVGENGGATELTKADLYKDMIVTLYLNASGDVMLVVVTAM